MVCTDALEAEPQFRVPGQLTDWRVDEAERKRSRAF